MNAVRMLLMCLLLANGLVAAVQADEPPVDPRLEAATRALADGDTLKAIDNLRRVDMERLDDPRWFMLLGRLYRERDTIESRLESQYVLERAVQLFPVHAGVALEMGLTYFSQTHYPDAARHFERALNLDPSLCLAKYKLGVTHYERWKLRVNAFLDEAEEARVYLGESLACDTTNVDAARRYVDVTYALDEPLQAARAARNFARRFPDIVDFPLMVAVVAYEQDEFVKADSAFAVAEALMTNEEWMAFHELTENVLGYEDLDRLEDIPLERQEVAQRAFWVGADPDPTTDLNEGELEHMRRVFRADLFFSHASVTQSWSRPQTRGWDTERGEFSIKWGWPDRIYASHGGERGEVWTYQREDKEPIRVRFIDRFGSGNLTVPSSDSVELVMVRYSPQVMSPSIGMLTVEGVLDAVAFKDDDFRCSIYTSMHANADSVLGAIDVESLGAFDVRTRFYDEDWNVEKDRESTIRAVDMARSEGYEYDLYEVLLQHEMPFGRYNVAVTFESDTKEARATARTAVDASHLARSQLTSSEILFLYDFTTGASFSRGGELLTPNPWRVYGPGQRVAAYLEVYNLAVVDGQSRYRVTYEINEDEDDDADTPWDRLGEFVGRFTGLDRGKLFVAQTFDRRGDAHRDSERIAIDVSSLPEGRHRLWVTIEDLESGQTWETSRAFMKLAPSVASE